MPAERGRTATAAGRARAATPADELPAWSVPDLREPRYSQSLERGLAILGCFTPERPLLGIADIAAELGMSRSTTHRYAITLVAMGYLQQGPARKYRLALRVTDLGMAAMSAMGLREHAHGPLEELRDRTGFTVGLSVLDGPEIAIVDLLRTHRRVGRKYDTGLTIGARVPAYCTAAGKVLLAHLPEAERRESLALMKPVRHTVNTITGKRMLQEELEQVLESGIALGDQEFAQGIQAIAAPVRDESRVVAAVSMSAHASLITLEELAAALGPHVISIADRVSARLGYRREDEIATSGRG
jgi:IclR family transcriptional regulator, pca regulon regulatory protein